jgi:hypothetical protein
VGKTLQIGTGHFAQLAIRPPGTQIVQNTHGGQTADKPSGEPPPRQGHISAYTACLVQAQESPSHTLDPSISRPIHPSFCLEVIRSQPTVFPQRGGFAVDTRQPVGYVP